MHSRTNAILEKLRDFFYFFYVEGLPDYLFYFYFLEKKHIFNFSCGDVESSLFFSLIFFDIFLAQSLHDLSNFFSKDIA